MYRLVKGDAHLSYTANTLEVYHFLQLWMHLPKNFNLQNGLGNHHRRVPNRTKQLENFRKNSPYGFGETVL